MAGYHLKEIEKGEYGQFSKVQEEFNELLDAREQKSSIMELVELSDLYGAIESYIENKYNIGMDELEKMSDITKRAFRSGHRK